jgi:hypothetical protein
VRARGAGRGGRDQQSEAGKAKATDDATAVDRIGFKRRWERFRENHEKSEERSTLAEADCVPKHGFSAAKSCRIPVEPIRRSRCDKQKRL